MDRRLSVLGAMIGLMLGIALGEMVHLLPKTADLKLLALYGAGALIGMSACVRR